MPFDSKNSQDYLNAIQEEALEKLGYFLKPEELFAEVSKRGNDDNTEEELYKGLEERPFVYNTK